MSAEQDLINKLMISKKIMERHDTMGRNGINNPQAFNSPMVEEYQPVNASYNLPQEFLSEAPVSTPKMNTEMPTAIYCLNCVTSLAFHESCLFPTVAFI